MEKFKPVNIELNPAEKMREAVINKAEQLGIPIFNQENIDEKLGNIPYFSHTIITDPAKLIKILETGELQSSKKSGIASMTYESDKLIGMDANVFLALGKGYMRTDTYGLIFDFETLAKMPTVSFVEDDLMKIEGDVIEEFLEAHKEKIVSSIEQKRNLLKGLFEKKVLHAFQGGHGIYEKYFGENCSDRVDDFLEAINLKGFKGISTEENIINQFTMERDSILSEEIMSPELRMELVALLQEQVIDPHTIIGEENIREAVAQCWNAGEISYKKFLSGDERVPAKVTELRVTSELDIKKAILGIYVPNK